MVLSGARTSGINVNITATGDFTAGPSSWLWDSIQTDKTFTFTSAGKVKLTMGNDSNGIYLSWALSTFNSSQFTVNAGAPVLVTSIDESTPSLTTDGGT